MKKYISLALAALLLAGCADKSHQVTYFRNLDPVQFAMLQISDNSKYTDAIPAGRYELSVDDDTAGSNPARYSVYVADEEYDMMNESLEQDLVNSIGPGQNLEINLKEGQYMYIAATSEKTGVYEDSLTGVLEIESE